MTDATWRKLPGSNDYDTGSNWSGNLVPDGTALFGTSKFHSLVFSDVNSVGGWTFKPGASHYSFQVPLGKFLEFTGAGIAIKGGGVKIVNDQDLHFENLSTSGKAHITNNEVTQFNGSSKAGASTITNNDYLVFLSSSTAGKAHITNRLNGSVIDFKGGSNAGSAHIDNSGNVNFRNDSSAKNATINSTFADVSFTDSSNAGHASINGHYVYFYSNAKADHAHITANQLSFYDATSAGAAVITVAKDAFLQFVDLSNGGAARLITKAGATIDFSKSSGPVSNHVISIGSIEGGGHFYLGENKFYVGSNNRSTKVSGAIDDGGSGGGSGAVLHKVGTGTLTLAHANNTYSLGTVLTQGTLHIAAKGAAGPDSIYFDGGKQVLRIDNKALTNHDFGNILSFFAEGDVIDLAGLKFVPGAKVSYNAATGLLTVKSGHVTDTLHMNDPGALIYKARDDGHGGTKVVADQNHAKPVAHSGGDRHDRADHPAAKVDAANPTSGDSFKFGELAGSGQQRGAEPNLHDRSSSSDYGGRPEDLYAAVHPGAHMDLAQDATNFHLAGPHLGNVTHDFFL